MRRGGTSRRNRHSSCFRRFLGRYPRGGGGGAGGGWGSRWGGGGWRGGGAGGGWRGWGRGGGGAPVGGGVGGGGGGGCRARWGGAARPGITAPGVGPGTDDTLGRHRNDGFPDRVRAGVSGIRVTGFIAPGIRNGLGPV